MCHSFVSFLLGHHKCRENWPVHAEKYERAFNLFLDVILLVLPLLMLGATYSLITKTLWQDMRGDGFGFCKSNSDLTKTRVCSSELLYLANESIIQMNKNTTKRPPYILKNTIILYHKSHRTVAISHSI